MTVILQSSTTSAQHGADFSCAVGATPMPLGSAMVPNITSRLENAFGRVRDSWWSLARDLANTPGADLAHMPTASTYASDFGQMAAWMDLVEELAAETSTTAVFCDDPWVFRAIAELPGVTAVNPPALLPSIVRRRVRGAAARFKHFVGLLHASRSLRHMRHNVKPGSPAILVYAHPESRSDGYDAYFSSLMAEIPDLIRVVHTDGDLSVPLRLSEDGRTFSLHAWGAVSDLRKIFGVYWWPGAVRTGTRYDWLVRRAAEIERGGASAAANAWQIACQERWLKAAQPSVVAWPWENHPWERAMVRMCRKHGIRTIGYQHTVVGRHMYNQSPNANADGVDALPDFILCNGPAYLENLATFGVPRERLRIGGTRRQRIAERDIYDSSAPVFVGLSNDPEFARQMVAALRPLSSDRCRFVVKEHPMCPYAFQDSEHFRRIQTPLGETPVSAVVYATGTIGLEALLNGLPTFRFRPTGFVAMDVLPDGVQPIDVDANTIGEALSGTMSRPKFNTSDVLHPTDPDVWRAIFDIAGVASQQQDRRNTAGARS